MSVVVAHHRGIAAALLAMIVFTGCGKTGASVAPVAGKVLIDGQPLASGSVNTLPAGGRGAHGTIQPDGSFSLGTNGPDDGALIGMHRVAVVAYAQSADNGPESPRGKSLVPQRYTNAETSGLTIDVKADEDNAPVLELTSP